MLNKCFLCSDQWTYRVEICFCLFHPCFLYPLYISLFSQRRRMRVNLCLTLSSAVSGPEISMEACLHLQTILTPIHPTRSVCTSQKVTSLKANERSLSGYSSAVRCQTVIGNDSMIDVCLKLTVFAYMGVLYFASEYLRTILFSLLLRYIQH